jgi:hypothetical protein
MQLQLLQETVQKNKIFMQKLAEEDEARKFQIQQYSQFISDLSNFCLHENIIDSTLLGKGIKSTDVLLNQLCQFITDYKSTHISLTEYENLKLQLEAKSGDEHYLLLQYKHEEIVRNELEKELDKFKLQELKNLTEKRMFQLDNENELEMSKVEIQSLKDQVCVLMQKLSEKSDGFEAVESTCMKLKESLKETEQKLLSNSKVIDRLKVENNKMAEEIETLNTSILSLQNRLFELQLKDEGDSSNREGEANLKIKIVELQSEISFLRSIVNESNMRNVEVEDSLTRANFQLNEKSKELFDLKTTKRLYEEVIMRCIDTLRDTEIKFGDFQESVLSMSSELITRIYRLSESCENNRKYVKRNSSVNEQYLRQTLADSQLALQNALLQHEEDDREINVLNDEIVNLKNELNHLREAWNESKHMESDLREKDEAIASLSKMLGATEKKLSIFTADQAQQFSQSARIIGYLESECYRLHGLSEYFRSTNVKLTDELRKSITKSTNLQQLESNYSSLLDQRLELLNKSSELEQKLSESHKENLDALTNMKTDYSQQITLLHYELSKSSELLLSKDTEIMDTQRQLNLLQIELAESENSSRKELLSLRNSYTESEKRRIVQARELSEKEAEVTELSNKVNYYLVELSQLDERQKLLEADYEARKRIEEQVRSELISEVEDLKLIITNCESISQSLEAAKQEKEEALSMKEKELAENLLKYSSLMEESSANYDELKALNNNVRQLISEKNDLVTKVATLEKSLVDEDNENSKLRKDLNIKSDLISNVEQQCRYVCIIFIFIFKFIHYFWLVIYKKNFRR